MTHPVVTKPGKHGTLYLHALRYTCDADPSGFGTAETRLWAYDFDHAADRFNASNEDGWRLLSIARVLAAGSQHHAAAHAVAS